MKIYTHKDCLLHIPGDKHPESPMRLDVVLAALRGYDICDTPLVGDDKILLFHTPEYLARLKAVNAEFSGVSIKIDEDTSICGDSLAAARRAVGAVTSAVDDVLADNSRAFCAVRPPGHHALPDSSMGFCIFNNIAIGAAYALQKGLGRVAIVDIDVHHGNGTQKLAESNENVLLISLHQAPLWPWSGSRDENRANILNIPFEPHTSANIYMQSFRDEVLPALDDFRPELIMVSAGFDAHLNDPPKEKLFNDPPGYQSLTDGHYQELAQLLCQSADRLCSGRLIAVLEGGYNTDVLPGACRAFVSGML